MPGPLTAARLVHIKIKLLLAESAIYTVLCQGLLLQPGQIKWNQISLKSIDRFDTEYNTVQKHSCTFSWFFTDHNIVQLS